ncbi:cystathionine beta-lyase [Sphingobium sp. LB126]|uniref:cystathionine beta-lyase n=1 Tax=Sphingobium sp. LB126 TaxID=1983755 RepID=UPI000C202A28|nr:cystathionine beta-lyase [Sphingobium sp. LB126]PJG47215.1 cystathionine beta-lyase [Sphingobium sp. LB126]
MHWRTRILHAQAAQSNDFHALATPVYRGSTVAFERVADIADDWRQKDGAYSYGLYGSPTVLELGARIAEMEGAYHSFIVPSGQAAISLVYLALCKAGDHGLVPISAYGPNRALAADLLKGFGVEVDLYDPGIGAGIANLIRPNTRLIWTESPGSATMEVQDIPAIVAAAKARDVLMALDNTYAAGVLFDAFAHGVDISIQALTKYVGGHSDLLLGSISVANSALYERIGTVRSQLGLSVSPDEASLALRGLQTLGMRLERLERSTLEIATWLSTRPEIAAVFHPALPSCPGHELWKRDFTGSASVFSILFSDDIPTEQVTSFVDALRLFQKGWSWGGTTALAMVYPEFKRSDADYSGRLVRLNVGLEEPTDLIADLERALTT